MPDATPPPPNRWARAWPDALAFVLGLGIAGLSGWNTGDLVWSLWLSSLVVGYSMIVWTIFIAGRPNLGRILVGLPILAFFTVHFGMFHFVHSMFLAHFFPPGGNPLAYSGNGPDVAPGLYLEVFSRYWFWVPVAFLAERAAFRRSAAPGFPAHGNAMFAPYKNVIRLHLLIFFFAFTRYAGLENYYIYAVVYAVYFFPWSLLLPAKPDPA